jgi:ribosomal protein S17E
MTTLAQAFGKQFAENKDAIRIKEFELGGHKFKVKIPLTSEYEAKMLEVKNPQQELIDKYYKELEDKYSNDPDFTIEKMQETAKNKAVTESTILAMVQMLVPEEVGFDMKTITYEMVEELFPFSVQMDLIENIADVISPSYKTTKGK